MTKDRYHRYWVLIVVVLVAVIVTGSITAWWRYRQSQPMEISIAEPKKGEQLNQIYIDGAVNNPGFYPLHQEDSLSDIIRAAGGTTTSADPSRLKLYIPETGKEGEPQKVDLNRASAWLLEALPGIGETRAQAIIAYRQQNGPFRHISELTRVEGIGDETYEQIKDFITVSD